METVSIGSAVMTAILIIGFIIVWGYGLAVLFGGMFGGWDDEKSGTSGRDYPEDNRTDYR